MAHDLRKINDMLVTTTVPVPNPYTALTSLTPQQQWFTCIDLANAFFCIPLQENLRDVFSFTYGNKQLRYTRLPQGFALSPGIFNQVLKQALTGCPLPEGTTLIQYVDDILLASTSAESCVEATDTILRWLATTGFKVSKSKLQVARRQVSFLGRVLSGSGSGLSAAHRSSILHHSRPQNVKEMLSFLGLTGFSRQFIPRYSNLTQILRAKVNEKGMMNLTAELDWDQGAEEAFITLKTELAQAADLAVPDYSAPFYLDVSETTGVVNGVLFQKKGEGKRKVLLYISAMMDNMEKRHHECTQHAAGVAKLLMKTAHIVMGHPLHVLTTHSIVAYVNSQTFTMTSLRQRRLSKLLEAPNLTFTHEGINMADHMREGKPHQCEYKVELEAKARTDLKSTPLTHFDWQLFTDGSCFRHPQHGLQSGYAVVRSNGAGTEVLEAGRIQGQQSAQRAEVLALIRALQLAEGKAVNIYTDSAYAVGAAHVELGQWLRAGFLTAGGKPIKHEPEMKDLAAALALPSTVAIIKCKGHEQSNSTVAKGNQAADQAAKQAAGYQMGLQMVNAEEEGQLGPQLNEEQIAEAQKGASPQEKTVWKQRGATEAGGLWRSPDGRPVLPPEIRNRCLQEAHGMAHVGHKQMNRNLCHWWHPFLADMTREYVKTCKICITFNPKPTVKPEMGVFPLTLVPGREIVIDYTDMITRCEGKRYLLVCVDALTGWPEAWPTKKEDSKSVIKCLINHYIPRHGFPEKVRSDNGTHFKNHDLQEVERMLGLKHAFGTVYHPQSQGKVERMNQNLKQKLAKICAQTNLTWVQALPLALMAIRSSVNQGTGFTPYELTTGRQFPGPSAGLKLQPDPETPTGEYASHYNELRALVSDFAVQVQDRTGGQNTPDPHTTAWVLLRVIKRKWSEPRWTGPYQVEERTSHAVRLRGKGDTWYHWSQCAPADEPGRTLQDILTTQQKETELGTG
ncbi:uncharacterized protein LOC134105111 isoform X1 [Pungitius pungitius]|uniref:uncharacterized protein LOC134105111 isoform X1 n=1 Tax=Pungitius pungitius TaxID=134920 RepID=UPI002E100F31